jgi:hypothetical protein
MTAIASPSSPGTRRTSAPCRAEPIWPVTASSSSPATAAVARTASVTQLRSVTRRPDRRHSSSTGRRSVRRAARAAAHSPPTAAAAEVAQASGGSATGVPGRSSTRLSAAVALAEVAVEVGGAGQQHRAPSRVAQHDAGVGIGPGRACRRPHRCRHGHKYAACLRITGDPFPGPQRDLAPGRDGDHNDGVAGPQRGPKAQQHHQRTLMISEGIGPGDGRVAAQRHLGGVSGQLPAGPHGNQLPVDQG